jgi:hypothetical protein
LFPAKLGLGPKDVGLFFGISSSFYLALGIVAGFITDRWSQYQAMICSVGMVSQSAGFFLLGPSPVTGLEKFGGISI